MHRKHQLATSMTNRNFYARHRRSPEDNTFTDVNKVLQTLLKKDHQTKKINFSAARTNRELIMTEAREELNPSTMACLEKKKKAEMLSKKLHPGWRKVVMCFQKLCKSQSIELLESNQVEFYESLTQLLLIELEKERKVKNVRNSELRENRKIDNSVMVENVRLEKENEMLKNQLIGKNVGLDQFISQEQKEGCHKPEEEESIMNFGRIKTLESRLSLKDQEMTILKREVDVVKEEIYLSRQEKKSLLERISELKQKNENLCSEIISLQIKNKTTGVKNEAIMMMQREEIESFHRQIHDLRKVYLNLNRKYKNMLVKFKKINHENYGKMGVIETKMGLIFPEQLKAFEQIKLKASQLKLNLDHGQNNRKQNLISQSSGLKANSYNTYKSYLNKQETLNNREAIKKLEKKHPTCQYLNPTFYSLILEDLNFFGIDKKNFENFNMKISITLMATMRGIMDSKLNHFLLSESEVTSFPAFTLSWLHTFQIGEDKKIEVNESSAREYICTFYTNLMSEKLNNSWQIVTFREFLFQSLGIDELYFYLRVRNLFLKGDITQFIDYAFEELYYIEFPKLFAMVMKFIPPKDASFRDIFEQFMKKSTVYIRKKTYLDLHFVLRVLLQYYQSVKQKEVERMVRTLDSTIYGKKAHISYSEFCKLFNFHLEFLSVTEIIELYRRCYCVGNGNVCTEIIISVLNQEGVFVKWAKQYFFSSNQFRVEEREKPEPSKVKISVKDESHNQREGQIHMEKNEEEDFAVYPAYPWLLKCEQVFRFIQNSQLRRELQRMGIEKTYDFFEKNSQLTESTVFPRFLELIKVCFFIGQKRYHSMKGEMMESSLNSMGQVIALTSNYLWELSKVTLRRNEIGELMRDLKQVRACSKIVRFFQKKKAEMTRTLLYACSSNQLDVKEEEEKGGIIRAEFMNIIETMREKKRQTVEIKLIE